jgi:aminoglycoside phosphotransferase (APT) family kinase protein
MIYPFIEHTPISGRDVSIGRLLDCLDELHENIQALDMPMHPYKTYRNWIERGHSQLKKRIQDHPFLDLFENFLMNRLRLLNFKVGNIHGDLNPYNVWLTEKNDLFFSDFDNLQKGDYAKDLFDSVAKYLVLDETHASINNLDFNKIANYSKKIISNVTKDDVGFLLIRPKLGDFFDPGSKLSDDQIIRRLDQLVLFLRKNSS